MKNPLQNIPVRAVRLALGALFASLAALAPSAAAHSPQAVDAQGNACIQVDCAGDKITNRCNFPVQLTSQCKGGGSLCAITGAFNSETAGEVKVLGTRDFGTEWERALLRDTDFYPKDIRRTNTSGGGREQFFGYACAVHTDGTVESAGGEWHKDDEGNSVFVCVHNHTDGQGRHIVRPTRPDFECPGERINNWAAECVEYKSYQSLTRSADGTENFAPSGHADGTYLVNNCRCPVVLDSCHGKHPCHQDVNRRVVLQPGENSFVAALPGSEASWAACYKDEDPYTEDLKSAGENLWACGEGKTACSEIVVAGDAAAEGLRFVGVSRAATAAPGVTAGAQEEGGRAPNCPKDMTSPQIPHEDHLDIPLVGETHNKNFERVRELLKCGADVNGHKGEGWTALHAAAFENAAEIAKMLIDRGAEVNAKENDGTTPLHWAATNNAAEIAKMLLANRANVNVKNKYGWTPLRLAAANNAAEVAKLLIANGAAVNAKNKVGQTPLHMAASNNAADAAKLLIANGAAVNAKDNDGWTPLDFAINHKHGAMQSLLRQHGGRCNYYDC